METSIVIEILQSIVIAASLAFCYFGYKYAKDSKAMYQDAEEYRKQALDSMESSEEQLNNARETLQVTKVHEEKIAGLLEAIQSGLDDDDEQG